MNLVSAFDLIEIVIYIGLAAMIIKIVVMPAFVDIVRQYRDLKKECEEEACQDQDH